MSMLEQTLQASYKSVRFLVNRTTTTGGIKSVEHIFPNSDNQVIENLGKKQKGYTLQAVINNDTEKGDYAAKRDALLDALESDGPGLLVHPIFGHIDNIVAVSWTLSEDFASLGEGLINIVFKVSLTQSVPQVASNTTSQVEEFSGSVVAAVTQDFAIDYAVDAFNNVSDSIEQLNDFVEDLRELTSVSALTSAVDKFNNQVSELGENVVSLIRTPLELAESIEGIFSTMSGMYASVEAAFTVVSSFFSTGDDDIEIKTTTVSKIERKSNRVILNDAIQAYALSNAYTLASKMEFTTIKEQQEVADILEVEYDKVTANKFIEDLKLDSQDISLSVHTKDLITDQRIAVEALFDDNRVTLGRVITVYTVPTSSRLLAYQYYGESTLGESIATLNNIKDSSFINGDIEIVTT